MKLAGKLFILGFSLFMITACGDASKEEDSSADELPPVTSIGANTLGFKLNNSVWVPKSENVISPISIEYNDGSLFLRAKRGSTETFIINYKNKIVKEGIYPMVFKSIPDDGTGFYRAENGLEYYSDNQFGTLIIDKLDKNERIISGTFSFNVIIPSEPDSKLFIKDGRFDMRY